MLLGREEVWRKVLGFLSQGISSDERFPKLQLIAPTQASGLAPHSVPLAGALKGRAMLGREVPACYQVCLGGCGEPGSLREIGMLQWMWLCENSQVFFYTPALFLSLPACLLFKTRPFPQEAAVTRHVEVILSCSSHGVQLVLHVGLLRLNVQQ